MQSKGIVNGINQAGKAAVPEESQSGAPVRKRPNSLVSSMMCLLNAFGNLVSPIKEAKPRRK